MTEPDQDLIERLRAMPSPVLAIEALWDGDTEGWFIDVCAVIAGDASPRSQVVRTISKGGDIRLFNGQVSPWPEAEEAAAFGRRLAEALGVPFHFPSPIHPEDDCPHWWQLPQSYPCRRCGVPLLQRADLPWRGVCCTCHRDTEREAREASWSPEERRAPKCLICGSPAVGEAEAPARCSSCRTKYRFDRCSCCGAEMMRSRDLPESKSCSQCEMKQHLASLSPAELERIRRAVATGTIPGLIEIRSVLGCSLADAQPAIHLLRPDSSAR
ncbi:MAG: hypothetical protein HOW73_25885 [Polyangiaceae bacterium]|nr:hypothetical protein [Polyangiaceae bacterium]